MVAWSHSGGAYRIHSTPQPAYAATPSAPARGQVQQQLSQAQEALQNPEIQAQMADMMQTMQNPQFIARMAELKVWACCVAVWFPSMQPGTYRSAWCLAALCPSPSWS